MTPLPALWAAKTLRMWFALDGRSGDQHQKRDAELLRVEEELHKRVISQDKAISALARAIRRSRAGLKSRIGPRQLPLLGPRRGQNGDGSHAANFLFGQTRR